MQGPRRRRAGTRRYSTRRRSRAWRRTCRTQPPARPTRWASASPTLDAARLALNEITDRTPEPARPIADSDARQLGIPEGTDVEPPGALMDLSRPAWVQGVSNDASDDERIAIQALEDAGYSTASPQSTRLRQCDARCWSSARSAGARPARPISFRRFPISQCSGSPPAPDDRYMRGVA